MRSSFVLFVKIHGFLLVSIIIIRWEKIPELLLAVFEIPNIKIKLGRLSEEQRAQLDKEKKTKMKVIRNKIVPLETKVNCFSTFVIKWKL